MILARCSSSAPGARVREPAVIRALRNSQQLGLRRLRGRAELSVQPPQHLVERLLVPDWGAFRKSGEQEPELLDRNPRAPPPGALVRVPDGALRVHRGALDIDPQVRVDVGKLGHVDV
jgi:hypothetical protein